MTFDQGPAVVHGSTAYFSEGNNVYSYTIPENKWTKLPECKYRCFGLAVVVGTLTTIGGRDRYRTITNALVSLSKNSWEEFLPPMRTKRTYPAAVTTPTHLVIAGGRSSLESELAKVEVLNTETFQWSRVSSLPAAASSPQMTVCGGCIYSAKLDGNTFSCSVESLLKSVDSRDGGSVWTTIDNIPVTDSSLVTLKGRMLAIGGIATRQLDHGLIHCYDAVIDSWGVIGEMPTPRSQVLTAVLPSNELVVVGGVSSGRYTSITEIGSCSTSPTTI